VPQESVSERGVVNEFYSTIVDIKEVEKSSRIGYNVNKYCIGESDAIIRVDSLYEIESAFGDINSVGSRPGRPFISGIN